ncbi:glycosyltransferase family 2 protein [Thalassotalea aquiviva]|uniref:glycosyltransferase family 2 protein n=1 Tax=Thalassotalea aquiviva TaxID=3242415 RepID=UPI00352A3359
MATYNGEKYIKMQLSSILEQIGSRDELIIVDDCSQDNTAKLVRSLNDERIKFIQNENNLGVVANFYKGLTEAKGDFIFLSDQDDYWEENKVSLISESLKNYDLVCHDCRVTDMKLNVTGESYFEFRKSGKGLLKNFFKNGYIGCCMAFKKEVFEAAHKGFLNAPMHDVWLGLVAEIKGFKVNFINEKLIKYRRHENVVSETGRNTQYIPTHKALRSRLTLLKLIINILYKK